MKKIDAGKLKELFSKTAEILISDSEEFSGIEKLMEIQKFNNFIADLTSHNPAAEVLDELEETIKKNISPGSDSYNVGRITGLAIALECIHEIRNRMEGE